MAALPDWPHGQGWQGSPWHRLAWRDACQGTGRRIGDHAGCAGHEPVTKPATWPARWFRDMRRPCLRCGADLPPADPGWGGRPRQYCGGAACRKAGQRLRATLGRDWWQHQRWYPAWVAAEERERQEQEDRAGAERRERGRQAEAIRRQAEEKRRKADEDRKLLESMPPQVRAGVEAGVEAVRQAEAERARRQFSLLALRMDLDLVSERHAKILAETDQRVQLSRQASRTEKLLWAAALAPDEAEAQALFAKAREVAAKDPARRPDAAISTADSFRAFFPPSPPGQLRPLVRRRRAGWLGRHRAGAVQE
jgi:hypothetical protein